VAAVSGGSVSRQLYGVFRDNGRGALLTNKRRALRLARIGRAIVGAVPADAFVGGRQYGIDGPTFRGLMTPIADFRQAKR
jgi:hypothetical protein